MQCGSLENQSIQSELREILNPQPTTWIGNKETVILPMMTRLGDRFVFPACTEIGQQVTNSDTAQSYLSTELLLDQSLILFAVTWYTSHHGLGFFLNLNLVRVQFSPAFYAIKLISPVHWNGLKKHWQNNSKTSKFSCKKEPIPRGSLSYPDIYLLKDSTVFIGIICSILFIPQHNWLASQVV